MTPESIDRVLPETPSEHDEVQSIMTGDFSATTEESDNTLMYRC